MSGAREASGSGGAFDGRGPDGKGGPRGVGGPAGVGWPRGARSAAAALPGLVLAGAGMWHPVSLTPQSAHHWWTMHVLLLPVFPTLALALLWLVSAERGVLGWVARLTGYGFATLYTGLDVLAGIAAGLVMETAGAGPPVSQLFVVADALGLAGVWLLLACVLAVAGLLARRSWSAGGGWRAPARVAPGLVILVGACLVFRHSHIFFPAGVAAMVGMAVGTALLALAVPTGPVCPHTGQLHTDRLQDGPS